jgi:hypothetical protein
MRVEELLGLSLQRRKPGRKPHDRLTDQLKLDIGNE